MYCPQCGTQLPDDSVFCESCGAKISNPGAGAPKAPQYTQQAPLQPQYSQTQPQNTAPQKQYTPPQARPYEGPAEGYRQQRPVKPQKQGGTVKIIIICAVILVVAAAIIVVANLGLFDKGGSKKNGKDSGKQVETEAKSEKKGDAYFDIEETKKSDSKSDGWGEKKDFPATEAATEGKKEKDKYAYVTVDMANLPEKGWNLYDELWYYVHDDGTLAVEEWIDDYYLGFDGAMVRNAWVGDDYVGDDGKRIGSVGDTTADQGHTVLTDYNEIAADLSTSESANAMDFEWFLDCVLQDGKGAGRVVTDGSYSTRLTYDMQPMVNGGWKAYMYTENPDGSFTNDGERYFNAEINTSGNRFDMTMNWKYMFDAYAGKSIEETGSDLFEGTWYNDDATGVAQSKYARVTMEGFWVNNDNTAMYAVGTFEWISGEVSRIALMRIKEF
ncbi:MAG: zinc-ribbon domain-containing protein [Eubacteriales bacterium]|nr:zinc-ribbon domain-containing protein [Eubacteriales bacterium]